MPSVISIKMPFKCKHTDGCEKQASFGLHGEKPRYWF